MQITYNEGAETFWLETMNCTYVIGLADGVYPGLIYFGKKINNDPDVQIDPSRYLRTDLRPFTPERLPGEKVSFFDCYPFEYPSGDTGDFRESAIRIRNNDGFTGCEFKLTSYNIKKGKAALKGLPAVFGDDNDVMSLDLILDDEVLGLTLTLRYSVFKDSDAVIRSASVHNHSDKPVYIEQMMSASIDLDPAKECDLITMYGSWARERQLDRLPLRHGKQSVSSDRGITSHQSQPFMALLDHDANESSGDVYAMHLIYSGNFLAQTELDQFDTIRMTIGISPKNFRWKLEPGDGFETPEAVLVYSDKGLNGMTHILHDLYREHLIRSKYLHKDRPVLINNWEATYFDFDEKKLLDIARTAKKCGIEMLVMDDGWFGHRDSDNSSLGDWYVYEKKLPGGLKGLADKINEIGLKFGLWMEPEMISPDSDLFREHPDYALQLKNREPSQARNQYVLDLSRQEVVDSVFDKIEKILSSANIEYVKWDMNRPLSDLGSICLDEDRAGELSHRYVLGVYQLQERLIERFPELLLENCAGGGSRFDPGMLYYSPQIWCSDDTDAYERLSIQESTAMIYPLSAIGAHVSICPNHITGRTTPWRMRGDTAMAGTFGYELDITSLTDEELDFIREQIKTFKCFSKLIREGDYYRIASGSTKELYDCWQVVAEDLSESIAVYTQIRAVPNAHSRKIFLKGLDKNAVYEVSMTREADSSDIDEKTGKAITGECESKFKLIGDAIMSLGIYIKPMMGDYRTVRISLKRM